MPQSISIRPQLTVSVSNPALARPMAKSRSISPPRPDREVFAGENRSVILGEFVTPFQLLFAEPPNGLNALAYSKNAAAFIDFGTPGTHEEFFMLLAHRFNYRPDRWGVDNFVVRFEFASGERYYSTLEITVEPDFKAFTGSVVRHAGAVRPFLSAEFCLDPALILSAETEIEETIPQPRTAVPIPAGETIVTACQVAPLTFHNPEYDPKEARAKLHVKDLGGNEVTMTATVQVGATNPFRPQNNTMRRPVTVQPVSAGSAFQGTSFFVRPPI